MRRDVDAGIARLDDFIEAMETIGPSLGPEELIERGYGNKKAEDGPWSIVFKPKKKKIKKKQAGFEGPKPGRRPVTRLREKSQVLSGRRSYQVGESSAAGESASEGMVGPASSLSILGTYKWVRKTFQLEPAVGCSASGPLPTTTRESMIDVGVADQDARDLVGPIQTTPVVLAGNHGDPGMPGAMLASQFNFSDSFGDIASGLAVAEQTENQVLEVQGSTQTTPAELFGAHGDSGEIGAVPASQFNPLDPINSKGLTGTELTENELLVVQGGDLMVEVIHSGVKDNAMVPLGSGSPVLVNGALSGLVEGQRVGDGILANPQQPSSLGMELVPFGEDEPIPLDWSHASEAGDGSGSQASGKEDEVIFAFSQIVGVSCDGQFDRLREAIALILAGKSYKPGKKSGGGRQGWKKRYA